MPGFLIGGVGAGPSGARESTRKHRFLVRVLNPLTTDLLFFAKKVSLPAPEIDRITMHHKQEEVHVPGKSRWGLAEITFYRVHQANGDQAALELYDWYLTIHSVIQSSLVASAETGSYNKRNVEIQALDGKGGAAYKYFLYGVWPHKITPDVFDSCDSTISEITAVLSVDKVVEQAHLSPANFMGVCGGRSGVEAGNSDDDI